MNDRADDPAAAVDLARVRKLLKDLAHPSPALVQVVELSQHDLESGDLLISGEHERHRGGGSKQRGGNGGRRGQSGVTIREVRVRPTRSLPPLVADYADGLTQVQIAMKHGLHVQTVRKRLIAAGVDTRAVVRRIENLQTFLTAAEVDRPVDDYVSGATVNELADRYGVHRATVPA